MPKPTLPKIRVSTRIRARDLQEDDLIGGYFVKRVKSWRDTIEVIVLMDTIPDRHATFTFDPKAKLHVSRLVIGSWV